MSEPNWVPSPDYDRWRGCLHCKHHTWQRGVFCAAYPDDPPWEILTGQVDHLVVRPEQVGDTVYEDNGLTVEETYQRGFEILERRQPA